MKHGKYKKALESFDQLQTSALLASRDFVLTHAQLDLESRLLKRELGSSEGLAIDENVHHPNGLRLDGTASYGSVSPRQVIEEVTAAEDGNGVSEPSLPHQDAAVGDSRHVNIELGATVETNSNSTMIDLEKAARRLRARNNPYSYHIGVTGYFSRLAQLWKVPRCRRALLCSAVAMISQQLTGVNSIAILGTIVWQSLLEKRAPYGVPYVNNAQENARIAAIIGLAFGAANYIAGLPAYHLADKVGRSIMLALGLPNMAWSMLVVALLFRIENYSVRTPLVAVFAVVFVLFYAPTAGTSPFSISAEVFPLVTREAGMAVSVAVNLLGAGMLVLVFPFVLNRIGPTAALSIFAALNVLAFVLVYLLCPETRMRKLEELQDSFDLSTLLHMEYRAVYIRRHVWKNASRYLMGKEVEPPLPFYRWADLPR